MQVRDAMSDDVQIASPNQSIRDAALLMAKIDAGVLPVSYTHLTLPTILRV